MSVEDVMMPTMFLMKVRLKRCFNKTFKQLCTNIEAFSTSAIFKIASRRINKVSYRLKNLRTVIRLMKRVKNDDGRVLVQFVCLVFGDNLLILLKNGAFLTRKQQEESPRLFFHTLTHRHLGAPPLNDSCCPKHTPAAF